MMHVVSFDHDFIVVLFTPYVQFVSDFLAVNHNSKIPALVDLQGSGGNHPNLFESGSIMLF
jgi:glutathione S-transferase